MATQDVTADWWPSRYGTEDLAGALNEMITVADAETALASAGRDVWPGDAVANALRVAHHIAGWLGATTQPEAQTLVTARA